VTLTILTLLCSLAAAVVESDRILRYCYIMSTHATTQAGNSSIGPVPENARLLDLREVARQTMQECKERERSHSPSMNLRKRKSTKVAATTNNTGDMMTASIQSPTQILNDLNNTHPTTSKQFIPSNASPPDSPTEGVLPSQGIISFLCSLLWSTTNNPAKHHGLPQIIRQNITKHPIANVILLLKTTTLTLLIQSLTMRRQPAPPAAKQAHPKSRRKIWKVRNLARRMGPTAAAVSCQIMAAMYLIIMV